MGLIFARANKVISTRANKVRVFVSYTRRDGEITNEKLRKFDARLRNNFSPFTHAIQQKNMRWQQFGVIAALTKCRALILIVSSQTDLSPWVRLELRLAKFLRCRIVKIAAQSLGDEAAVSACERQLSEISTTRLMQENGKLGGHRKSISATNSSRFR